MAKSWRNSISAAAAHLAAAAAWQLINEEMKYSYQRRNGGENSWRQRVAAQRLSGGIQQLKWPGENGVMKS